MVQLLRHDAAHGIRDRREWGREPRTGAEQTGTRRTSGGEADLHPGIPARPHPRVSLPVELMSGLLGFAAVVAVAFSHGGYYPTAWGTSAVVALWLVVVRLVFVDVSLGMLEVLSLSALTGFMCWVAASSAWGVPERAILETERIAVYVGALVAACVGLRRHAVPALLAGVWAAVTVVCGYGLVTRLFPERWWVFDPLAGYRLSEPLGYWNGLGVFAALGALLAVGLASRGSTMVGRTLAAASLPVLVTTLYFTFSRGAWIALAVGLVAAIAVDASRLRLVTHALALAPAVVIALVVAYESPALNQLGASLGDASREGHRLALVVALAAVLEGVVVLGLEQVERRGGAHPRLRRAYVAGLVGASLLVLLVLFVRVGSPLTLASRTYHAFAAPPPSLNGRLNSRIFNLSGSGRVVQWRVAWRAYERNPLLGSGAGTYEESWNELRPAPYKIRDAHSLYLETLSELGPIGLGLLLGALSIPLVAGVRARNVPLVPGAFAAYVAFLVHAGVDWDWELPAVTLAGLLCAATLLVAARGRRRIALSRYVRLGVIAGVLGVAAFSVVGLIGNRALADGETALNDGRATLAAKRARLALRWSPWSAQAHRLLGESQLAVGNLRDAPKNMRRAVEADPRDWTLWFALAQTTSGPERERALAEARKLDPRGPEIRFYLSSVGVAP
jgi:hypothetical protein